MTSEVDSGTAQAVSSKEERTLSVGRDGSHPASSTAGLGDNVPLLPSQKQDVLDPDDGYHQAGFAGAVFNLSTTIVGAGIMALPATLKVLGLPLGIVTIAVAGYLTSLSIEFMNRYSEPCKARSYGGLMFDSFGNVGRSLTQLCVIINNGGILIVYVIIIGDVLAGTADHTGIFVEWAGAFTWWNSRIFVVFVIMILILAPLSSLRHVDSLKHSSALSMALAGVFLFITVAVTLIRLVEGKVDMPRLLPDIYDLQSLGRLFTVVPIMVTAYICHHNLHPIANELKHPSPEQIRGICRAALALCTSIYIATAFFGYLLFGEDTSSDILADFDVDLGVPFSKFWGTTVRISYAVHVMLVFPLLNFSLRLNVDSFLFPKAPPLAGDTRRFAITTFVLLVLIFLGSTVVPDIWIAFEFTGATASVCLGFIFPGLLALKDRAGIAKRKDKLLASAMVVVAVISSVSATTSNIFDLMSPS